MIVEERRWAARENAGERSSGSRAETLRNRIVFGLMLAVVLMTYALLAYSSWSMIPFLWSGAFGEK